MFIPVEPAFLLALDRQPELITEALKNNIMLVSPTTLLVALRTIANLWRYEHQSRNAQKIAERASKLYDKMRLFVDDMSSVGQSLDRAQDNYRQAMKKLASGRGNLLAQAEAFRGLGWRSNARLIRNWWSRPRRKTKSSVCVKAQMNKRHPAKTTS
jgi:DNA recombination protein RmuC